MAKTEKLITEEPRAAARPRTPDAVIFPAGYFARRLDRIQAKFGAILGGTLYCRNQGNHTFATTDPADTLLFPTWHDLAKEPRYEWEDVPGEDGVRYGYLVDGALETRKGPPAE